MPCDLLSTLGVTVFKIINIMKAKKRKYFQITKPDGTIHYETGNFQEVCSLFKLPYHALKQGKAQWKHKGIEYNGFKIKEIYK